MVPPFFGNLLLVHWLNCHVHGKLEGCLEGSPEAASSHGKSDVQLQDVQLQDVQVWEKWGSDTRCLARTFWDVSLTSILLSTIAAISESHRIAGFMIQPYPTYSFCRLIMPYFAALRRQGHGLGVASQFGAQQESQVGLAIHVTPPRCCPY